MNELESKLKDMIKEEYGSLKKFSDKIGMPWTTIDSILKRGIPNSNITNVLKITKELGIDAEKLVEGEIVRPQKPSSQPHTIAAHFEGDEYTEEELAAIQAYAEFVKNRRNSNK